MPHAQTLPERRLHREKVLKIDKKKIARRFLIAAAALAAVPLAVLCLRPGLISLVSRPKRPVAPKTGPRCPRKLRSRRSEPGRVPTSPTMMALENLKMAEMMEKSEREMFASPPFDPDAPED